MDFNPPEQKQQQQSVFRQVQVPYKNKKYMALIIENKAQYSAFWNDEIKSRLDDFYKATNNFIKMIQGSTSSAEAIEKRLMEIRSGISKTKLLFKSILQHQNSLYEKAEMNESLTMAQVNKIQHLRKIICETLLPRHTGPNTPLSLIHI